MKKDDKLNILHVSIGTYNICRCLFNYDPDCCYYYIAGVSDKLFYCIEEDDFSVDGFEIHKISDLRSVEMQDDIHCKINEEHKLLANVVPPEIELSSWKTVFGSLKPLNVFVIVENRRCGNNEGFFYIGSIAEIKKSCVVFSPFDADGIWGDNVEIPYSDITNITFNCRYSKTWQEYLSQHK